VSAVEVAIECSEREKEDRERGRDQERHEIKYNSG
jgi:hypothetical protein